MALCLLIVCAPVLLMTAALLLLPIDISFEVATEPRVRAHVQLTWARWLRFRLPMGKERPIAEGEHARDGTSVDADRCGRAGQRGFWQRMPFRKRAKRSRRVTSKGRRLAMPGWDMIRYGMSFARRLLAETQIRRLNGRVCVGLDNPADTGMLFGAAAPLVALLGPHSRLTLEPSFWEERLECEAEGELRLILARYVTVLLAFMLAPQTWRFYRQVMAASRP